MRITIIDVEWFMKKSFLPNPKCMKLSSYYKQQNGIINFPNTTFEIGLDYDLMYVIKENENSSVPTGIKLLDSKVVLMGKGFRFYSKYVDGIDDVVAACRPDYNLYPIREENRMSKCNIVQFFHQGKPLPLIQNYQNAYKRTKNTYVIDENFWDYPSDVIEPMVKKLQKEKSIIFAGTINFKSIIQEERKAQLFSSLKVDYLNNDFHCNFETIAELDRFTEIMRKTSKSTRTRIKITIPIHYQNDHFEYPNQPLLDFMSYFKFLDDMKKLQVNIILLAPSRALSPFWFYFEDFEAWTKTNLHLSYVEFMTLPRRLFTKQYDVFVFLSDKRNLSGDDIDRMRTLWVWYPQIMEKYSYTCWGDRRIVGLDMKRIFKTSVIGGKE